MDNRERSDDQLVADLKAADEYVRAAAAVELVRRRHPRALEACLATLNDAAEFTHSYSTPAVWQLVGFGAGALGPLLDRLDDAEPMTRLRAAYAVMEISKRQFGFDGHQWRPPGYERWAAWWTAIGYQYDAEPTARAAALDRLHLACAPWLPEASP